jgi:hypothetical protein
MKKNTNYLPFLLVGLVLVIIVKAVKAKSLGPITGSKGGSTPEQKMANLKSQLATAYTSGDNTKIVKLQRDIEILELETGL